MNRRDPVDRGSITGRRSTPSLVLQASASFRSLFVSSLLDNFLPPLLLRRFNLIWIFFFFPSFHFFLSLSLPSLPDLLTRSISVNRSLHHSRHSSIRQPLTATIPIRSPRLSPTRLLKHHRSPIQLSRSGRRPLAPPPIFSPQDAHRFHPPLTPPSNAPLAIHAAEKTRRWAEKGRHSLCQRPSRL